MVKTICFGGNLINTNANHPKILAFLALIVFSAVMVDQIPEGGNDE